MPSGRLSARSLRLGGLPAYVAELLTVGARESRRIGPTALAANVTTFDLGGMNGDVDGGILLIVRGSSVGSGAGAVSLRLNGLATGITRAGFSSGVGSVPTLAGDATGAAIAYNAAGGAAGAKWTVVVEFRDVRSGRYRTFRVLASGQQNPTTDSWGIGEYLMTWWGSTAALTSIGLESSVAGDIAASTTYEVVRL